MDGEVQSAAAAPAASATPVAAPVATPAAPSAPAPATEPVVSAPAPSAGVEAPAVGDEQEFIRKQLAGIDFDKAEDPAAATQVEDEVDPAGAPATSTNGEEKPAVEAGTDGEAKPAVSGEEEIDGDPFELEPLGIITAEGLAKDLRDKPELAAALDKYPELKNSIFAAARRSGRLEDFEQHFATPAEAATAAEASANLSNLSSVVTAAKDIDGARKALSAMVQMSALLDENGQPVPDGRGGIKTDGSVGRFAHNLFGAGLDMWSRSAEENDDPELAAAVDVLRARAGFAESAPSTQEHMTEEQRRQAADLEQRSQSVAERERALRATQVETWNKGVDDAVEATVDKRIAGLFKAVALDDTQKANAIRDIKGGIYELIRDNSRYNTRLDGLTRMPMNDVTAKQRVALASEYIQAYLPNVARKVLATYGAKRMEQQQQQTEKQAARADASRSEANTTPRVSKPVQQSAEERHRLAVETLTARLNRTPEIEEIIRFNLEQANAR
jgi:hypothetical protein